jgi:hypothetical protein
MNTGFLWVTLGIGLAVLAPSRVMAQQAPPATPPVKITLLNGNILSGTVAAADADGLTFNLQSGPMRFAWTQLDTNELKKTTPALYDHMLGLKSGFAAAQAAPQPKTAGRRGKNDVITLRLLDGTQLEGTASRVDARGFSFRTRYATTHYDWAQIDTNALKQVDADLYQTMIEKIREAAAHPASGTVTTLRLRDGTQLEGRVSTSPGDTLGFMLQTALGRVHYDWIQLDLAHLQQNSPALYQFMLQQRLVDQITTDDQIIQFLSGKFIFRSDANKELKSYGTVISRLQGIIRSKGSTARNRQTAVQRSQQLADLINTETSRATLKAFDLRVQQLRSVTPTLALQNLLTNYHIALDALLSNNPASFQTTYTYCLEALAGFTGGK